MTIEQQLELIKRGTVEIISEKQLFDKLYKSQKEKRSLVIKAGFDPTAPDIHLGHTVLLRKLRHFQQLGHKVIFLIGDYTATIGDPSGASKTRPRLTKEEIEKNAATYREQIGRILDIRKLHVCFNSDWLSRHMDAEGVAVLLSKYSVSRMLERDDFSKRYKEQKSISMLEFLYPLLQGYDSVALNADIEVGGTDQRFNLLIGRDLQSAYGQQPQVVITMPLLVGIDGVDKMSKSLGNHIGISEEPAQMFGKIMSLSDEMMYKYYELLTDANLDKLRSMHPMEAKKSLAGEIIRQYHGQTAVQEAGRGFEETFQRRDPFSHKSEVVLEVMDPEKGFFLSNVLCDWHNRKLYRLEHKEAVGENEEDLKSSVKSKSEFRRLVEQSAVSVNGKKVTDINYKLEPRKVQCIKVGKLKFVKVILK